MQERKKVWFAASGDVIRMGPFDTDVDAWTAIVLRGSNTARRYAENAKVWPEYEEKADESFGD